MAQYEYKVVIYTGNPANPQFPGNTKIDTVEFAEFLNKEGVEGWEAISVKQRGIPTLFQHEEYVVIMKRVINKRSKRSKKK